MVIKMKTLNEIIWDEDGAFFEDDEDTGVMSIGVRCMSICCGGSGCYIPAMIVGCMGPLCT